jgi:hypothetical protein
MDDAFFEVEGKVEIVTEMAVDFVHLAWPPPPPSEVAVKAAVEAIKMCRLAVEGAQAAAVAASEAAEKAYSLANPVVVIPPPVAARGGGWIVYQDDGMPVYKESFGTDHANSEEEEEEELCGIVWPAETPVPAPPIWPPLPLSPLPLPGQIELTLHA